MCQSKKAPRGGGTSNTRNSGQQPTQATQSSNPRPVRAVQDDTSEQTEEYSLHNVNSPVPNKPIMLEVVINNQSLSMELDTGSAVTLVSEHIFKSKWPDTPLQVSNVKLRTYSNESLQVLGQIEAKIQYNKQEVQLPLIIVKGNGPSLFGRDWLAHIQLDWKKIHSIQKCGVAKVLERHSHVFKETLGTLQGYEAHLYVDPQVKPRYCKARPIPYSMRTIVEQELDRLVSDGILEPVQFADWASPIVPVLKADGRSVRICGDFKLLNQACKLDKYPLPKIEDLFVQVAGGKAFTKLDLSQAYQQVSLAEESRKYVVINTHRGLFRYNRMPFGVSSAPGVFQRVMENLLKDIPKVVVYLDDILITGETESEHLATLEEVLRRLAGAGLHLKREKCTFLAPSFAYLGFKIDSQGLHPVSEKVQAIQNAPQPHNQSSLKSYLGLLSYYSRFLPNLPNTLAPLYQLLHKSTQWKWGKQEREAFKASKDLLLSSQVLVHFDPKHPIVLACDVSAHGIGAVLSHKFTDGSEKPIGFVSRTLTDTEKKYSQVEKEGLACVFGVSRFHTYLFGHKFTLVTDNKAIVSLFDPSRNVSPQASGRIQRWSLKLAMYQYTLKFRPTAQHANADALSRLPLPDKPDGVPLPGELVLLVDHLAEAPITAAQLKVWTARDKLLSKVLHFIRHGWPDNSVDSEMKPYFTKRWELTELDGCIIWCSRVLIPPQAREHILAELHCGHPGGARMKSLARRFVWWPGMDQQIEETVKECPECQQSQASPPVAPLCSWQWPTRPWSRIHIDFAGPMDDLTFLVIIDAHSKWIEVFKMNSTTATATIRELRSVFARFGIPESIVSDNGPQFTSSEFTEFCRLNGIRHVRVLPYHPSSNGLAERAVQTFKKGFKKMLNGTVQDKIARFLFSYRITPQTTTGTSPAELLMGRTLRSRLHLLKPNLSQNVENKQEQQKLSHDKRAVERTFVDGERVFARNYSKIGKKWLPGIAISVAQRSVKVKLTNGLVIHRHFDQVHKRTINDPPAESAPESDPEAYTYISVNSDEPVVSESMSSSEAPVVEQLPHNQRYPLRIRKAPDRLNL